MTIKVRLRHDTKEPRWQVDLWAMPPEAKKARRYRYSAPRSITSKSGALRWGEGVRRDIESGEGREEAAPPPAVEVAAPAVEVLTLSAATDLYLEDCAGRGDAVGTLTTKRSRLANICGVVGDAPIDTVGEAQASKLRAALRARGMLASTINAHLRLVQHLTKRLHDLGYRSTPGTRLETVSDRRVKVPKAYDDATFEALVSVAAGIDGDHLALVLVCGEAALRVGEACGLEVRDLDKHGCLHIERSMAADGTIGPPKNGEARVLPLTGRTLAALMALTVGRGRGEGLITGRAGRLDQQDARTYLERCQRAAGLPAKGIHVLRHSCASSALAHGADVVAVQKLLGHRSLKTTLDAYLHDTGDAPQRAVTALAARANVTASVTDASQVPRSNRKPRQKAAKGVSAATPRI